MVCRTPHGIRRGHSTRKGGPSWITALTNSTITPTLSYSFANRIQEQSLRKSIVCPAPQSSTRLYFPHPDILLNQRLQSIMCRAPTEHTSTASTQATVLYQTKRYFETIAYAQKALTILPAARG